MIERNVASNAELARLAGLNENTIRGWQKNGRKRYPVSDDMVRIARALGTSVEYLVTGDGPAAPVRPDPDVDQILGLLRGLNHDQLTAIWAIVKQFADTNFNEPQKSQAG